MKTSRIHNAEAACFGLFAIIRSKRVVLPLKGVECDFAVLSGIMEVSLTQIFRQENDQSLDCEYLFPLPADAAVFSCEADINGRIIRAQVHEREEARQMAAAKKAAGFRTALIECDRDNLFTLSLGNVQSLDLVVIRVKYFQTLRSLAETRAVEIPFCPGIRYIPGKPLLRANAGKGVVDDTEEVPDASRITPVRIDAEHPDAAFIEVRGTIESKFVINCLMDRAGAIASESILREGTPDGDSAELFESDRALRPLVQPSPPRDESSLKGELSDICRRIALSDWESLVHALFDWIAEGRGSERMRRIEALDALIGEVRQCVAPIYAPGTQLGSEQVDVVRRGVQHLLKSFVEELPVWG